jgi:hypothetical protein
VGSFRQNTSKSTNHLSRSSTQNKQSPTALPRPHHHSTKLKTIDSATSANFTLQRHLAQLNYSTTSQRYSSSIHNEQYFKTTHLERSLNTRTHPTHLPKLQFIEQLYHHAHHASPQRKFYTIRPTSPATTRHQTHSHQVQLPTKNKPLSNQERIKHKKKGQKTEKRSCLYCPVLYVIANRKQNQERNKWNQEIGTKKHGTKKSEGILRHCKSF